MNAPTADVWASIPDDVLKATNAACDELSRHTAALGLADFTELQRVVARAIMAERERIEALMKDPAAVRINWLRGTVACQHLIDEAVTAERERCARLAEGVCVPIFDDSPEWERDTNEDLRMVAAAIRKGEA